MIVKNIVTNEIVTCEKLLISSFKPKGLKTVISSIPKTNYIIGVGYSEGDYQICISGRRKQNENIYATIKREMYEELSIVPTESPSVVMRDDKNFFSIINLRQTSLLNYNIFPQIGDRDSNDRAVICIHGTKKDITDYISNVKLKENNGDYITHIWADTAENILKYF